MYRLRSIPRWIAVFFVATFFTTTRAPATDQLSQLLEKFRREKRPDEMIKAAFSLAELSLNENPMTSLQFISLIEARTGLNRNIKPFLVYYKARVFAAAGQYQAAVDQLTLTHDFTAPIELQKRIIELELDSLFRLQQSERFLSIYEIYAQRFPLYVQLETIRKSAADFYLKHGNAGQHIRLLESLAEKYPLTEGSRSALRTLISYSCLDSRQTHLKTYIFPQELIQKINWQSALDPGLNTWVSWQATQPVRTKEGHVRHLTIREQVEWLLRLKKFAAAQESIQNAQLLGKVLENDKADFKAFEAQALQGLGKQPHALALYQDLLVQHPKYWREATILERIGYLQGRLGYHAQAAATFATLGKRTGNIRLRWLNFLYTFRAKNYAEAQLLLQDFNREHHPDLSRHALLYWEVRVLEKLNRTIEAKQILSRFVHHPSEAFYTLMISHRNKGLGRLLAKTTAIKEIDELAPEDIDELDDSTDLVEDQSQQNETSLPPIRIKESVNSSLNVVKLQEWILDLQHLAQNGGLTDTSHATSAPEIKDEKDFPLVYFDIVSREGKKNNTDPYLLLSIIRAESQYRKDALSPVGALGLMQLMPFTAMRIATELGDGNFTLNTLLDPLPNVAYGAYYFGKLLNFYGNNIAVALAAYNAGPTAVEQWLESCRDCELDEFIDGITFKETRNYVKKILRFYATYSRLYNNDKAFALQETLPKEFDRSINIY